MKERVWRKVQDRHHKNLSGAGKIIMIKNVARTIPAYSMSCFLLPKSLCSKMEKMMNSYWWGSNGRNTIGIKWHAWRKIATAKCNGGLRFRYLHGFNVALFGKHTWSFCTKPNSLVARLFKARYFPNDHILNAKKRYGSIFIWTGIWEGKEQLRKGFRWILEDGKDFQAFRDPWLKGKVDFCVEDDHVNVIRTEKVCNYFHLDIKEWDVHKIMHDFHNADIQFVLRTKIPQNNVKERIAWNDSTTGMYTVKTGYQFRASKHLANVPSTDPRGWNNLWKL